MQSLSTVSLRKLKQTKQLMLKRKRMKKEIKLQIQKMRWKQKKFATNLRNLRSEELLEF